MKKTISVILTLMLVIPLVSSIVMGNEIMESCSSIKQEYSLLKERSSEIMHEYYNEKDSGGMSIYDMPSIQKRIKYLRIMLRRIC